MFAVKDYFDAYYIVSLGEKGNSYAILINNLHMESIAFKNKTQRKQIHLSVV